MSTTETQTTDNSQTSTERTATSEVPEETVTKKAFENVTKDLHKWKEEAKLAKDKLKEIETEKLKAAQKFEELAAMNEKEAKEAKTELQNLKQGLIREKKLSAIKAEAAKLKILPSALDDLELQDWSEVQIEATSTGKINVLNAQKAVERFKTTKPHWFEGTSAPNVNTTTPTTVTSDSGKVTHEDLNKAEALAKKSGDYSAYKAMTLKFKEQLSKH